jgi:hypothetical protein
MLLLEFLGESESRLFGPDRFHGASFGFQDICDFHNLFLTGGAGAQKRRISPLSCPLQSQLRAQCEQYLFEMIGGAAALLKEEGHQALFRVTS